MKAKKALLTKEERDVLLLAHAHPNCQHLQNAEIGQLMGISVSKVKRLIHQACTKLKANNRYDALISAVRQGEISINELFTLDELAELLSSLYPDGVRRIAHFVREGPEHGHLAEEDEQINNTGRIQDSILTKCEQNVLILIGRGFTNREIADELCLSLSTVATFIYRACTKLGTHNRADAWILAAKRREISIGEIYSLKELLPFFAPLGAETLEKIAKLMSEKLELEPVTTGS